MSNRVHVVALLLVVAACSGLPTQASDTPQAADVRITNAHLVPACINGTAVTRDQRRWKLSAKTAFVFTMRNEPRSGIPNHQPGNAAIEFTPQPGHVYEIEVRGDAIAFSQRVWTEGEWKPVVRDRTTDTIVSTNPTWVERDCSI